MPPDRDPNAALSPRPNEPAPRSGLGSGAEAAPRRHRLRSIPGPAALGLLGALAIGTLGFGLSGALGEQREASEAVQHAQVVLLRAASLELHIQTAVSEGRGFRISNDPADLTRLAVASGAVDDDVRALRALTAANASQRAKVEGLAPLVASRLRLLRELAGIDPRQGSTYSLSPQALPVAVEIMARVADGLRQIEQQETERLAERQGAIARARDRATICLAVGGALLSASVLLTLGLMRRRRRDQQHFSALREINLTLDRRVVERTADLQRMTDQLRAANERAKLAIDSGGIGVWDWDIAHDRMDWDDRMYRLYGMAPCDTGTVELWTRHMHPDDLAAAQAVLKAAIDGIAPFDTEFRVVWTDGSVHHIRGMGQVTRDESGRAARMVGVNWDVTEQRRLAAELVRQAERQAEAAERETAFFRNSTDFQYVVGVVDAADAPAFVFESASPAALAVTGWTPDAILGQRPEECFPAKVAAIVNERFRACLDKGATYSYVQTCVTQDGARECEGSITPIRHPATGAITRLAGSLRDVTERKRMQDALHHGQKMHAIGRLAAGVAHDFNNILQSVSGNLELLLDDFPPDAPEHGYVSVALRAARRGGKLTHHLLAYARKQLLRQEDVVLAALLADLEVLLRPTVGPRVRITVRCDPAITGVRTDPAQLETALLNLAINASHAMPEGGTLEIAARPAEDAGERWVVIRVTDTGTGMDAATLALAVEPFFTTKGLKGTGLGLSMVQGFVEQSGGRFHIASTPGVGTTVELRLPARASDSATADEGDASRRVEPPAACVLLVDDDTDVLLTTAAFLEKAGFQVLPAADATSALDLLAEDRSIDVLVSDYAMPGMTGIDLIAAARRRRPELPAIVMSGFVEIKETASLGGDIVRLHKPFPRETLIEAIRQTVGQTVGQYNDPDPPLAAVKEVAAIP